MAPSGHRSLVVVVVALIASLTPPGSASAEHADPEFSVDEETLEAALDCDPFTRFDREPVLLVHGTGTTGHEQWDWNYGTSLASGSPPTGQPAAFYQFSPDSQFVQALNAGDETPGDIDYTSIYTAFDELVQPVEPPTAALDLGQDNPRVANIDLQDVCPARIVDHFTIGTTDRLTQLLTIDALDHDGPARVDRVAPDPALCNLPDQFVVPATATTLLARLPAAFESGPPEFARVTEEPPLRDYATGADHHGVDDDAEGPPPDAIAGSAADAPSATAMLTATLPSTGRTIPFLAAGVAVGIALLLRAGRSRLDDQPDEPSEDDHPGGR